MATLEILISGDESVIGTATVKAQVFGATQAGLMVRVTKHYHGGSDWLTLFGAGHVIRGEARRQQLEAGGKVASWDLGYFGSGKDPATSYMRVSIDHFHPQAYIGKTEPSPERWARHEIALLSDYNPAGHVVVVGMGPKSRDQFSLYDWEIKALQAAQARFPDRRILYRPKRDAKRLDWEQDGTSPIADVIRGASLVIARHSNVSVDACVAGVPVECEDGAAKWLYGPDRNPSAAKRLDFLQRLACWQYQLSEAAEAWRFLLKVSA